MSELAQPRGPFADRFALVGTLLEGRYRVDRVVAEGGFGIVYRAHHVGLDRPVALKALKLDDGPGRLPEFRAHFDAEARTMARLKHPNIADVYDSGIAQVGGREIPWIALEWVEGTTLEERLEARREQGGMRPREALALLRPALEAFAHAHRHGIAHRDIKPANMMVTEDAHGTQLRVLDFGISKMMSPDEQAGTGRTRTGGAFAFSPGYASPEQISGGRTGPWTDVHALGLVLTELLTGKVAIEGADIALFAQVLADARPTPKRKGHDVGAWEEVLQKALALQPSQRWKDAGALLAALENTVDAAEAHVRALNAPAAQRPTKVLEHPELAATAAVRPAPRTIAAGEETLPGTTTVRVAGGGRGRTVAIALVALAGVATAVAAIRELRAPPAAPPPAAVVPAPAPVPAAPPPVVTPPPAAAAAEPVPAASPRPRPTRERPAPPKRAAPKSEAPAKKPATDPSDLPIR